MFGILLIIFFAYRCLSIDKEVRMYQLYHYQVTRLWTHLLNTLVVTKQKLLRLCLHVPFICLCFAQQAQLQLLILLFIVYFYVVYKSNMALQRHVSLRYTKRVQRFYVVLFLFYSTILLLTKQSVYFLWVVLGLMAINPLVVMLLALCMHPVEMAIRYIYVALARRKLSEHRQLQKVGVVGSYGKTSTKNIMYHLLSDRYFCLKSQRSFNNLMGNTLMIRQELKRLHEVMIAEMGSDHVGELQRLMNFIQPQYVIITSIGNQHMETFKTQDNIIKEKTSPLLCLQPYDTAFINIDNEYLYAHRHLGRCQKKYFGEHEKAHYRLCDIQLYEWGSTFHVEYQNRKYAFTTKLLGYYNIMNICGSIAVAHTMHISFAQMQKSVQQLQPIEHRLQSIEKKGYTLIDNAYNSNVKSFANSLAILARIRKYRILITPGLIDLKEDAKVNFDLMAKVKDSVDEVIVVGYKNRMALCDGLRYYHFDHFHIMDTMEAALAYVDNLERSDFVVLIENDIDKDYMNL